MFIRRQVGNLRRVMRAIDQCPSFGARGSCFSETQSSARSSLKLCTVNRLMGATGAILHDERRLSGRSRFEGEMDVVGPDLGHIVGVGHVDLDASDAFAVMALRFRHDRFQVVRHGLASIDVGVHVQQNLHSSVQVLL